jgi:hypothetical protein
MKKLPERLPGFPERLQVFFLEAPGELPRGPRALLLGSWGPLGTQKKWDGGSIKNIYLSSIFFSFFFYHVDDSGAREVDVVVGFLSVEVIVFGVRTEGGHPAVAPAPTHNDRVHERRDDEGVNEVPVCIVYSVWCMMVMVMVWLAK